MRAPTSTPPSPGRRAVRRAADLELRVALEELVALDERRQVRLVGDVEEDGEDADQEADDVELPERQRRPRGTRAGSSEQQRAAEVADDEDRLAPQPVDPDARGKREQDERQELERCRAAATSKAVASRTMIATRASASCEICEPNWLIVSAAQSLRKSRCRHEPAWARACASAPRRPVEGGGEAPRLAVGRLGGPHVLHELVEPAVEALGGGRRRGGCAAGRACRPPGLPRPRPPRCEARLRRRRAGARRPARRSSCRGRAARHGRSTSPSRHARAGCARRARGRPARAPSGGVRRCPWASREVRPAHSPRPPARAGARRCGLAPRR